MKKKANLKGDIIMGLASIFLKGLVKNAADRAAGLAAIHGPDLIDKGTKLVNQAAATATALSAAAESGLKQVEEKAVKLAGNVTGAVEKTFNKEAAAAPAAKAKKSSAKKPVAKKDRGKKSKSS
jgi:hypothetical protein